MNPTRKRLFQEPDAPVYNNYEGRVQAAITKKKRLSFKRPESQIVTVARENLEQTVVAIHHKQYQLQKLKETHSVPHHAAYDFVGEGVMRLGEQERSIQNLVLKAIVPGYDVKPQDKLNKDQSHFLFLASQKLPLPERFTQGIHFEETLNPAYGEMWIEEKLPTPVDPALWKDINDIHDLEPNMRDTLYLAQTLFTATAFRGSKQVNDLTPQGIRLNREGKPVIADTSYPQRFEGDFHQHVHNCIKQWAGGNKVVYHFLMHGFSEELKKKIKSRD